MKSRDELEGIANKLGLVVERKESNHDICDRIALVTSQIAPAKTVTISGVASEPFTRKELMVALSGHIKAGLRVSIEDDCFSFSHAKKSDSGTLKQPLKVILRCASALVQPL